MTSRRDARNSRLSCAVENLEKRQISAVVRVNICFINPRENVKVFFVSKIETRGSKKTPAFKLGWIIDVVGRHLTTQAVD